MDKQFRALRLNARELKLGETYVSFRINSKNDVVSDGYTMVKISAIDYDHAIVKGRLDGHGVVKEFTFAELGLRVGQNRCLMHYRVAQGVLEATRSRDPDQLNRGYNHDRVGLALLDSIGSGRQLLGLSA